MTRRPSWLGRIARALVHEWDASISGISAILFWVLVGASSRPLDSAQGLLTAAVALGSAVGSASLVTGRWLSDRLQKDEYGAVISAFDVDESKTQRPYKIMTFAGFTTGLLAIVLLVLVGELPRPLTVAA